MTDFENTKIRYNTARYKTKKLYVMSEPSRDYPDSLNLVYIELYYRPGRSHVAYSWDDGNKGSTMFFNGHKDYILENVENHIKEYFTILSIDAPKGEF